MLIFGGLVHESVRNDLWSMDVRDCTTMTVKTKGDAPMPRVGHAAAIADRIMIVWGGDTKVRPEDAQDEGLYILDLRELSLSMCLQLKLTGRNTGVDESTRSTRSSGKIRSRSNHARFQILHLRRTSRGSIHE
jgi:hypothetical protein